MGFALGDAYLTAPSATGAIHFRLAAEDDNSTVGGTDRGKWEIPAGESITLTYRTWTTGIVPPVAPNGTAGDLFQILLLQDDNAAGADLIRSIYDSDAPPANGTTYTIWATHDGTQTGTPSQGFVSIFMRAIQANELVNNYDVQNNVGGEGDEGHLRWIWQPEAADISISAYPASDKFAYGPATDEVFTVTVNYPRVPARIQPGNAWQIRVDIMDGAGVQIAGTAFDADTTGQKVLNLTANESFDLAEKEYSVRATIVGTHGNTGFPWTRFEGDRYALITDDNDTIILRDVAKAGGISSLLEATTVGSELNKNDTCYDAVNDRIMSVGSNNDRVQTWNPTTLAIIDNVVELTFTTPTGIAHDGTNPWVLNQSTGHIYKLDDTTLLVASTHTHDRGSNLLWGLAWDGANFWCGDRTTSEIVKFDSSFNTISTFSTGALILGLDFYKGNIIALDSNETVSIIDPATGTVLDSLDFPSSPTLNGMAMIEENTDVIVEFDDPLNALWEDQFKVDPRITLQAPTLSKSLHNTGDDTTIDVEIINSRGESLTRSITLRLKDSLGASKATPTDSGPNYDLNYHLLAADDHADDFVGKQWVMDLVSPVYNAGNVNVFKVSGKVMIGSAVGLNDLAINTDFEVYNGGYTVAYDFYVSAADGTAFTRSVTAEVHSDVHGVENTRTESNGDGHFQDTYVVASGDKSVSTKTGSLKHISITADDGNIADESNAEWGVSSLRVGHSSDTLPGGDPLNADNTIASAATQTSDDGGTGDRTLLNTKEAADITYYLFDARGDPWPFSFTQKVIAANSNTEDSQTESADGAGLVTTAYTTEDGDQATNAGSPKHIRVESSDGNDTVNFDDGWNLSNYRLMGSAVGLDDGELVIEFGAIGSGDDGTVSGLYPVALANPYSGQAPIAMTTFISYRRGTKCATQPANTEIHNDVHGIEDAQSLSTDADGKLEVTYSVAQSDKASEHVAKTTGGYSALPTGSPKHLIVTNGDNTSRDSLEKWGVTKHFYIDAHDEREQPLDKDTWNLLNPLDGSENANEELFQYVILGDTFHAWAHVMDVQFNEVQTWDGDTGPYPANRAVRLSTIKPSGSTHASFITDTGADGWTAGRDDDEDGELDTSPGGGDPDHAQNLGTPWIQATGSMTPASANWQFKAEVDFEGCSGVASDLITIASPLVTSKLTLFYPATVLPGETFRVHAFVADKAVASGETLSTFQPAVPEGVPQLTGSTILSGAPDIVEDDIVAREADKNGTSMFNVVDDAATVNGSLYYLDVTAPAVAGENIQWFAVAALGGDTVAQGITSVREPDFDFALGSIRS